MSCEQWPPEKLISCLSYQPSHMLQGMISISGSPKPCAIQRDHSSSSIGLLGTLPLEILHLIFNMLDFQSLSHVSRVSLHGRAVVSSLPAYQSLREHVPATLAALDRTKIIGLHSVAVLYAALKSEKCVSCDHYGPFLFLPTCDRCCYNCLARNPSLWVITTALANSGFGLKPRQYKRLPILHSIPGVYSVRYRISRQRSIRLVSVRAAKELAISIYGSPEKLLDAVVARRTYLEFGNIYAHLHNASLDPRGQDPSTLPNYPDMPKEKDKSCGMASIRFPSLSTNNVLENGLWCRGCEQAFGGSEFTQLPPNVASNLTPVGHKPPWVFQEMKDRARSRAEFLDHITHCHGRHKLMSFIMKRESEQKMI
jgi:drug/metabolite transporter superfamily protein YnfA